MSSGSAGAPGLLAGLDRETEAAARIWTVVESTAAGLAEHRAAGGAVPALSAGLAGQALLYGYLARAGRPGWYEAMEAAITGAVERTRQVGPQGRGGLSLYGGALGVAWAIEHLRGAGLLETVDDPNEDVDSAVMEVLERQEWTGHYDLVFGLVGIGTYLLERLPRDGAAAGLAQVVRHLDALSEPHGGLVRWRSPLPAAGSPNAVFYERGLFDLGMAHGMAGVIAVLASVLAAGIREKACRRLLRGAVGYVLEQRLPSGAPSLLPSFVVTGEMPRHARLAWCYGDPGVATALLLASRALGDGALREEALRMGRSAALRVRDTGVRDAGLCHGAAGLGLLFGRMHEASGEEILASAARRWAQEALSMNSGTETRPRFLIWNAMQARMERRFGFLDGEAGIALFLLRTCSPEPPAWDRLLLASGP